MVVRLTFRPSVPVVRPTGYNVACAHRTYGLLEDYRNRIRRPVTQSENYNNINNIVITNADPAGRLARCSRCRNRATAVRLKLSFFFRSTSARLVYERLFFLLSPDPFRPWRHFFSFARRLFDAYANIISLCIFHVTCFPNTEVLLHRPGTKDRSK